MTKHTELERWIENVEEKCKTSSNSVIFRGERILFFGSNTNTNIIRNQNFDRIRIRMLFGIRILTEYKYE